MKGHTVDGVTEQRARHLPAAGRANLNAQRGRVHIHHRQLQRRNVGAQLWLRRLLLHQRAAEAIVCTINKMALGPTSSNKNVSCLLQLTGRPILDSRPSAVSTPSSSASNVAAPVRHWGLYNI